jgi:hypothetical protein
MGRFQFAVVIIAIPPCVAIANTPVFFPPGEQLAKSSAVVIAVPRSISCRTTDANTSSGLVKAQAKVTWQVLVRWKGILRVGDTFTSDETFLADSQSCFYSYRQPLLLYLNGKQPFGEVWWYELPESVDRLKELDDYRQRHGT